jgi:peptidoglycan/LPS O-acetylase OafA/YrhL
MAVLPQPVAVTEYTSPKPTLVSSHLDYRPDVDGLRAIAVLAVIIFHAFPELLPGGFVGVDIFFVISGFLISGIILRALARDRFSLLDFYGRRVKRIFPALIVMLAGVWVLGRAVLLADEYQVLGKHIMAGASFVFNLVLYRDTKEYFGAISTPLVHLWSLGVEEQFYLVWPLFLWAIWRLRKGQLGAITLAAAVSFGFNVAAAASHPLAAFYLPWNRLWELAMGGALAHVQLQESEQLNGIWTGVVQRLPWLARLLGSHARGFAGVTLLLTSFAFIKGDMAFPGWWALGPCVGAFLIISAGPRGWVNRHFLSWPTMVFVGLISYPLYLWHWPLLSLMHTVDWREFNALTKLAAVATAFVLATLTYKFVELPVRQSVKTMQLARVLCAAMVVCAAVGFLTFSKKIPARPVSQEISRFVTAATEGDPYPDDEGFVTVGSAPRRTLFIGDSTIAQYHGRMERLLEQHPANSRAAVFAWRAGCAPSPELALVNPEGCRKLLQEAVDYAKDPQVDTVVVGFCWYAYFVGILDDDRVGESGSLAPGTDHALQDLKRMLSGFVQQGKRVYLLLQLPVDSAFPPRQMIRRTVLGAGFRIDVRPASRTIITRNIAPFESRLSQIAQDTGSTLINPMDSLCDGYTCTPVTAEGEPIFHDSWHLRKTYIKDHVTYLDATLLDGSFASKPEAPLVSKGH